VMVKHKVTDIIIQFTYIHVFTILSIILYGCERWTLTAKCGGRIQTFEHKSNTKILCISYHEHKMYAFAGLQEQILSVVKRYKLAWYGHVNQHIPNFLSKTLCPKTANGSHKRSG
jgi:hypothetical protein